MRSDKVVTLRPARPAPSSAMRSLYIETVEATLAAIRQYRDKGEAIPHALLETAVELNAIRHRYRIGGRLTLNGG